MPKGLNLWSWSPFATNLTTYQMTPQSLKMYPSKQHSMSKMKSTFDQQDQFPVGSPVAVILQPYVCGMV